MENKIIEQLKEENELLRAQAEKLNLLRENQKKGMINKASQGKIMSRVPFGYSLSKGNLILAENFREVEEIFEEFLNSTISLRQLAKKHNFSTNGIKKILKNFTYVGKIKFNNEIHEGNHQPIISSTLFNHVQNKLERIKTKKQ
jgi:site-specific DNA recombinase